MLAQLLLPDAQALSLESWTLHEHTMILTVSTTQIQACCPACQTNSGRVHSSYTRKLADLPCGIYQVWLHWTVRRFFCDNPGCKRRTFTEQLPAMAARYARKTQRLACRQRRMAFALGGEGSTGLAAVFTMPLSADTSLRLIRQAPDPQRPTPRVLGVDDWAKRKGQTYGTILVDLERHQVVDLLAERTPEALAGWLQAHPGVEIVSRDRATVYADGTHRAAPEATQVADRWHLLKNLGDAVRRLLDRHPKVLRDTAQHLANISNPPVVTDMPSSKAIGPAETPAQEPPESKAPRSRAEIDYHEVHALRQQGWSQRRIAKHLKLHRNTVRRYLNCDEFPGRARGYQTVSTVTPYLAYLKQRSAEGCHNFKQLWQELKQQGYTGSYSSVWRAASKLFGRRRGAATSTTNTKVTAPRLSARQAAWLLVRRPEELTPDDETTRQVLCQLCPAATAAYPAVQDFARIVRERKADALDGWLQQAETSTVPELKRFAASLRGDYAAVKNALLLPWSNGQTEGQIQRLKLIKRQMYGRANLDLLKRRVLGMPLAP